MLDLRREIRKILLEEHNDNFKTWFGNSKVILNGEPRVVYHGTSKKFSKFSLKKTPQPIIWFTTNKDAITSGDVGAAGSGHIMELYISLQNPAGWAEYEKYGLGQLKGLGYDGAILPSPDGNYDGFVFEPSQIKSPQNKGEWNPNNKNIYKESTTDVLDKKRQLKNNKSVIVYRGISPDGKNFYRGNVPLPFTYYTLNRDKAEYYGNVHQFLFNRNGTPIKIFFGSLFDKFGLDSHIENPQVINQLKAEGFSAALQKGDELIVFDAKLISQEGGNALSENDERQLGKNLADQVKTQWVTLYRACPTSVTEFRDRDYCTLSKRFAIEHAENNHVYHEEPYHVIEGLVATKNVFDALNPGEYFYSGPPKKARVIYISKGPDEFEGLEEDNVAFPMQKRVFAENAESFQPKITEVNKYYYHQTSCSNAESILKNGFTYPNVGRADYTHGIYFLNFPDANYGPCTIQTIITGNFLDFSNPDDKFGDGWLNFKNSFDANNPEELTKKVRAAYPDLDGIIPMEKMIVVWNTDSLSLIKLHSKK